MSNVSKIKIGQSVHDIKDAPLTDRVSELDEVTAEVLAEHEEKIADIDEIAAAALNDIANVEPLSDDEVDYLFADKTPILAIYTENFGDYDAETWARENGYGSLQALLDSLNGTVFYDGLNGVQKFVNSGDTFDYNGKTYQLWEINTLNEGATGIYGLLPLTEYFSHLKKMSMKVDSDNRYNPFVGVVMEDEFYATKPEGEWSVLDVE